MADEWNELKACKDAVMMQDACNLMGVTGSFREHLIAATHKLGTSEAKKHPAICLMFDKMCDLMGIFSRDNPNENTGEVFRIISEQEPEYLNYIQKYSMTFGGSNCYGYAK